MPINAGVSADFSREKLDRRVSVAPMLDWTDEADSTNKIINLGAAKMACLLYVSSNRV
jgi:tRNA-dihydrouridine synthase